MAFEEMGLFKGRRSIRRYTADALPREKVERMLEAAIWAPSAHNRQPWRFAVIDGQRTKERLARAMGRKLRADLTADGAPQVVTDKDVNRSYSRVTSAPALIVVALSMADMDSYPDEERQKSEWLMAVQSTAMAGQNMLLAAHALGLGACWMCAPLFCPDVVRETLELPADWLPQGLVTVGYPAEVREKDRRPLAEVACYIP